MSVDFNRKAVEQVMRDPKLARELLADGWKIAEVAAQLAPKDTGRGARSIRAELVKGRGDPEVRVSWDVSAFWMGFQELGTEERSARPFLRTAASRFR